MKSPRTTPESQDAPTSLKKDLTTPLLYFFILGDVLGAGVHVLVGEVAATAGGAVRVPLLVALCLALLTAASYAELATKHPRAGGASHYATPAYGPFTGFVAGFCMLAAGAVYALVGAAAAAAVPTEKPAGSSGPLLEVVRTAGGVPTRLFSAIALVAVANGALLTGIMSSRRPMAWLATGCCRAS